MRRNSGQERSVETLMVVHEDGHGSCRGKQPCGSPLGLLEQGVPTEQNAELLGAIIANELPSQRAKARAVSAGKNQRPTRVRVHAMPLYSVAAQVALGQPAFISVSRCIAARRASPEES